MNTTRHAWLLCGLLFVATALSFLDRQVLSVLAPRLMTEFGMSNTVYGRVVFAFVLAYTVMFAVGGRILDRIGTRLGLGLSVALWSVASALHAWAAGPWTLGGARLLLGLGEGACFPAATKGAIEWMRPERRALAVGLANGGSAFGAVLAPPLTAWCAAAFGWRAAFLATAAMGLAWLAAWHYGTRGLESGVRAPRSSGFAVLLGRADVRRFVAARFLFDPVFYLYMFWLPQYLARERGLSLAEIGRLTWIPFFALGITNIGAGQLSDLLVQRGWTARRARLTLMGLSAAVSPALLLVTRAGSAEGAVALLSLLTMAHGVWIANFITHIGDSVGAADVGTTVGLTGMAGGFAAMGANLAIGMVVDRASFAPVFVAAAALYPLAWLILIRKAQK
jgi:ACS family hexuronate transporter-like MFS transporter